MEIELATLPKLITDLPEEPMQIVLSSLGPKDIVFWSWVDTNCYRKVLQHQPLLQEIHTEYRKKNHTVILLYKFLNKTKYVGFVITFPLAVLLISMFRAPLVACLMISSTHSLCIYELTSNYLNGCKVYRREPTKKTSEYGLERPDIDFAEGEGPLHRNTIIFNLLWLTFGFGLPLALFIFLIGLLQMMIIVGITSGCETIRLAWYLLWPSGYQYFRFKSEYISKSEWERGERLRDLKTRYMDQHSISTSSTRHQQVV